MADSQPSHDGHWEPRSRDDELISAARREVEHARQASQSSSDRHRVSSDDSTFHSVDFSDSPRADAPVRLPKDAFTGYEMLKEVHRGGQGVVYLAIQASTRRRVAIKVMKEGPFAGPADKARFDREVQILGQLKAPNIVAIHETGLAAGCHYFVMDYISGQPLDAYLRTRPHSVAETLRLFQRICDAINTAHLRGIIHRDIKPSNIRVDSHGQPHVLDFGLAKVVSSAPDRPTGTLTGQFVGSLPWASPEQAAGRPARIDLRTDVYSLGVVLFQMLTGRFPYDVTGNMRDVLNRILDAEPVRPSAYRREINDEVETIVLKCLQKDPERRYQTAGELSRDIGRYFAGEPLEAKRDSGWYVLRKTLYRYRASAGVAAAFIALVIGFSIWMGVLYSEADHLRRVAEAERSATAREADAARAINGFFNQMFAAVDPMQLRAISAYAPAEYIATVPAGGLTRDASVADMLRWAGDHVDQAFPGAPELEATVRETLGMTWRGLGLYADALPHLEQAVNIRHYHFGPHHPETLRARLALGGVLADAGRSAEAEPHVQLACREMRRLFGDDDARTLSCAAIMATVHANLGRYAESDTLFQTTYLRQRTALGDEHRDTLATMFAWSISYLSRWQLAEGQALARDLHEIAARTLSADDTLNILSRPLVGWWYLEQCRYHDAEAVLRPGLEQSRRLLGPEHPFTFITMNGLARAVRGPAHRAEREQLQRAALTGLRATRGRLHWHSISAATEFADWLTELGRFAEAEELYRNAVADCRELFGPAHQHTRDSLLRLAGFLERQGDIDEAAELYLERLELVRDHDGRLSLPWFDAVRETSRTLVRLGRLDQAGAVMGHLLELLERATQRRRPHPLALNNYAWFLLICEPEDLRDPHKALLLARQAVEAIGNQRSAVLDTLALACFETGDTAQAVEVQLQSLDLLPPDAARDLNYGASLVRYLLAQNDVAAADRFVQKSIEMFRAALGPDNPMLAMEFNRGGVALMDAGHYSMSEAIFQEALALNRRVLGPQHEQVAATLTNLADLYHRQGRYVDAAVCYRRAVEIEQVAFGADHLRVARTLHDLGRTLHAAGATDDAAHVLRLALRIYVQRGVPNLPEAYRLRCDLGCALIPAGDFEAAEELLAQALTNQRATYGEEHWSTVAALEALGLLEVERGHPERAEPMLRRCAELAQVLHASRTAPASLARAHATLGYCLLKRGALAEAEPLLISGYELLCDTVGPRSAETRTALRRVITLYETWANADAARHWRTHQAGLDAQPPVDDLQRSASSADPLRGD